MNHNWTIRKLSAFIACLAFAACLTAPPALAQSNSKTASNPKVTASSSKAAKKSHTTKKKTASKHTAKRSATAADKNLHVQPMKNGTPEKRTAIQPGGPAGVIKVQAGPGRSTTILPIPSGGNTGPGSVSQTQTTTSPEGNPFASQSGNAATITLDYRGSDIANVLKFFAMAANWQIVPDPNLTGPVTIICPKPLTLDQAFQVLQSTLEVRGFSGQLETRGQTTILKIVSLDRAVQSTPLLERPLYDKDGKPIAQTPLSLDELKNQVITQVFPLDNVDASTLSRELAPLINKGASLVGSSGTNALIVTDTASNVQRIGELVDALDRSASNNAIKIFQLKHSDATDVTNAINNLFKQVFTRGRPSGGIPGQPGQPPMQPQPGQPGMPAGGAERGAIVATSDTRTNSVLVVASDDNMKRVGDLISQLDDEKATALSTKIVKVKFADAQDVSDLVNSILSGSVPTRQGAQGRNNARGYGGYNPYGGQSQGVASTDPFGKVVADARTNTLIITATDERMKEIDTLITEIDVDVPAETTTFVIPLKNAQAQDVAYTLGEAFGTSSGNNNNNNPFAMFYGFGNNNSQRRTNIQRRQGSSSSTGRAAAVSRAAQPISVIDSNGVHGTMTDGVFVPDPPQEAEAPDSRQYYFGGGGYYGRNSQMNTPQYGRGQQGNFVNLLQLRQNVGVTADLGSNSLIVTTTPDNMNAIREIIESLDIVPRQVMIEVIIAEASLDATQKLGFQFDAKGVGHLLGTDASQSGSTNFPASGAGNTVSNIASPLNPGAQYGIQALNGQFNALVQAIASDNRIRILSTPKIFTSNNQEATIDITTHVPYVTNTTYSVYGSSSSYQYLDLGISLDVTPRITKEGLVTIDVVSTASDLLGFDTVASTEDANGHITNQLAPRWSERSADTSVSVRDGEIIALGGLMRDSKTVSVNKVPLLGDIPIIGSLFRSTNTENNKTELMIFMIPHVVDGDKTTRALTQKQSETIRKAIPELQKQQPMLDPANKTPLYTPGGKSDQVKPKEEKKQ